MSPPVGLSPDQQALLSRLLARDGARIPVAAEASVGSSALVPDLPNRHAPFPLTDIQRAYWLGRSQSLALGGVASHGYQEYECGRLDLARFEAAWRTVIARHDMLRAIVDVDGRMRILAETPPFTIPVEDLSESSPGQRETRLAEIRASMSHRVPKPEAWPLLILRVSRLGPDRDRIHLSCDAIIADVYSMFLAFDEVGRLYDDPGLALPALDLSFRDYVLVTQAQEASAAFAASERYWLDRLDTLSPPPELPLAPEMLGRVPRFVRHSLQLSAPRWQALKRRATSLGLTPSLVLLTAYAECLRAWSRNPAFTLNLTLFNRPPLHPEIDRIMGDFTSTLLLDLGAPEDESFAERVRRGQEQFWADYPHAAFTGVRVLQRLAQRRRTTVAMPIVFTSALGVGDVGRKLDLAGRLLGRPTYSITQTPQVQIDHQVFEIDGRLGVNWDVVEGLFAPGVIEAMFAAYRDLLERLAAADIPENADPSSADPWSAPRPLRLPPAQLAARAALDDTAADLGPDALLHAAILEQARATPERIALVDPERSLTYARLAAEAEALAAELDARLGPPRQADARVALALHKGWRQAVAVLAVLVCGRAYVPLDPDLPPARRQAILAQARPDAVLTEHGLIEALRTDVAACAEAARAQAGGDEARDEPGGAACPVLGVDPRPEAVLAPCPPPPRAAPDDLAYVIFTSGSTGLPKGVMIAHAAALNTVRDLNARLGLGPEDAVFGLSALSFDLSVYDLFGPLSRGGRLILPAPGEARDPQAWAARMRAHPVTVWNTVPALWQMLVEHAPRLPAPPRAVLLSGDWIPLELIPRSRGLYPDSRLIALGGATEASIWSVIHPIEGAPGPDWSSVPYGRPLANQRLRVLGPDLSPRPDWVAGDLYIVGSGLARGYLGDAARTAASFMRHPESGERLYRTGDLARVRPEGGAGFTVEFLGREDQQVKVGGHRIELGEIEAVLSGCSGVSGAVAAVRGAAAGPRHLAAWVVARETASPPDLADLWSALRARLPAYMLPRSLGLIDALPLSQNGKIDRTRLPADETQSETIAKGEPPDSPAERILAAAWAAVLEDASPSRGDHFFECGGDSLRAVRMVNRLRDAHHQALPLMQVFADPVLARLAMHLRPIAAALVLEPITTADANGRPIFCIGDALSEGAAFRPLAATWTGRRALVAVPGRIDDEGGNALAHTVAATIEALRAWQRTGPYTLVGYSTGGLIAWEIAAALERAGETIDGLILIDSRPLPPSLAEDGDTLRRILAQVGIGSALEPVLRRTVKAGAQARLSPITAPVLLLEAENQPEELPPLREAWSGAEAPQRGPALHAVTVGGDHFTCLHPPHAEAVAEAIARFITACPLEAAR